MKANREHQLKDQPPWTLGVDFATQSFQMVLLERRPRSNLTVRSCREFPVPADIKADSAAYSRYLGECIAESIQSVRGSVEVWTAQKPDQVRIHQLDVTSTSESQLPAAVFWAVQREEAFEARDFLLDFEIEGIHPTQQGKGRRYRVSAFLVEKKELWAVEHLFLAAGFPLSGIVLPVRALGHLISGEWLAGENEAVALAQIGDLTSRFAVYEGLEASVLRSIPLGMDSLGRAVSGDFGDRMNESEALRMLRESTSGELRQEMLESIEPGLDRMARQIERTVSFYQNSTRKYGAVNRVFTSGSIAAFPTLMDRLAGHLSLPMEAIDPFAHPFIEADETIVPSPENRPAFATAFGLALSPARKGQNFLRPFGMRLREKAAGRIAKGILAAFIASVLVCGFIYGWRLYELSEARQTYRETVLRFESLNTANQPDNLLQRLDALETLKGQLISRAEGLEVTALISEISRLTPPEIELTRLTANLEAPRESGSGESPAARWIQLDGASRDDGLGAENRVNLFARSLGNSPLVDSAEVTATSTGGRRDQELAFTLRLQLPHLNPLTGEDLP